MANPVLAKTRRFDTVAVMFSLFASKRVTEALAELGGITLLAKEAGSSRGAICCIRFISSA
jgi:hypothetical protein